MSKLNVNQIEKTILKLFENKIDLTDIDHKKDEDKKNNLLTRTLAAYSLYYLASLDIDVASNAVVDGFGDNGIDAIAYDRNQNILWIVQSKWIKKGDGEPSNGEIVKFTAGIRDLLDSSLDRFNDRIKSKEKLITAALDNPALKLNIIITYTGKGFSEHNKRTMGDIISELNDISEFANYQIFSLKEAHKSLTGSMDGKPIQVEILLQNWGYLDQPYQAYYGIVSTEDVAKWWIDNRGKLFSENIRNFIGNTEVNEGIIKTFNEEPQHFIYFNNGITILCQKIDKKPLGGGDKANGIFVCEGISIVNGAQTVGAIGNSFNMQNNKLKDAKIFVKLISLEKCPSDFGVKITKATNTQNKIEKKDFVSLDPEQERLRTELLLDGIKYHYKRTEEKIPPDNENCTLEEATVSIACAIYDVNLTVQAKREIGKLWENTSKKPYLEIFNSSLNSRYLWSCIKVLREVNVSLVSIAKKYSGREKSCYIHGNRFILHIVFRSLQNYIHKEEFKIDDYLKANFQSKVEEIVNKIWLIIVEEYPKDMIHQIFRNFTKCTNLESKIILSLK